MNLRKVIFIFWYVNTIFNYIHVFIFVIIQKNVQEATQIQVYTIVYNCFEINNIHISFQALTKGLHGLLRRWLLSHRNSVSVSYTFWNTTVWIFSRIWICFCLSNWNIWSGGDVMIVYGPRDQSRDQCSKANV